jgi:hypothetical protein
MHIPVDNQYPLEAADAQGMAGDLPSVRIDSSGNSVNLDPISAASMAYTAAATGTVVSIADRHMIHFHHVGATSEGVWIAVNSAVATAAQGIPVFPGNPLSLEVGAGVAIGWTASGATKLVITQTSRP